MIDAFWLMVDVSLFLAFLSPSLQEKKGRNEAEFKIELVL